MARDISDSQPPITPVPECRLDPGGLRNQGDRYRALGRHVQRMRRAPRRLDVNFSSEVDSALLEETLGIERECCSFLGLTYDEDTRQLSITVEDPAHGPALDALHHALS